MQIGQKDAVFVRLARILEHFRLRGTPRGPSPNRPPPSSARRSACPVSQIVSDRQRDFKVCLCLVQIESTSLSVLSISLSGTNFEVYRCLVQTYLFLVQIGSKDAVFVQLVMWSVLGPAGNSARSITKPSATLERSPLRLSGQSNSIRQTKRF